jgi:uncharacterized protein (TIRG00374 family)
MHQSPSSPGPDLGADRSAFGSPQARPAAGRRPENGSPDRRRRSARFGRFDRAAIGKGLKIFFGLSVASIAIIFMFTDRDKMLGALSRVEPGYLFLALILAVADWCGGGVRLYLLTRGLSANVSLRNATKAALANTAMGAITPSQMGGGPAQVFLLYKNGLPLLEAMSASLMTFVVTMVFFVAAAGAITFSGVNTSIADETVRQLFRYGFIVFLVCGTLFMVFIARPSWLRLLLRWFFSFLSLFRRRHFLRPGSRANRAIEATAQIHEINVYYVRNRFPALLLSLLMTAVVFGCKCFVAYFIVRGLGVAAGVWDVVSIQILILLAVYFFPTPGGTGAAELGSAVLMAQIVPIELLMVYVVLWRVVVMYLAVILGSAVMLRALGQDTLVATRPGYGTVEKKIAVSSE